MSERSAIQPQKLEDEGEIMKLTRADKEEVVFYNNRDYEISVDEGTYVHVLGLGLISLAVLG